MKIKIDHIKANRKGSRDAELEDSKGWDAVHKIHKSKKDFIRKPKHKNRGYNEELDDI